MRIETMVEALDRAAYRRGIRKDNETEYQRYLLIAVKLELGIARRYIRLQQENARLRDEVAFWKAEALKDGNDE